MEGATRALGTAMLDAPDAGRMGNALVRLSSGAALYLREVAPHIVAVAVGREGSALAAEAPGSAAMAAAAAGAPPARPAPSGLALPWKGLVNHNLEVLGSALGMLWREKAQSI